MAKANRRSKRHRITKPSIVIGTLIAGFLLFLANIAVWVNRQVFDTENFTATTKSALLSDSSVNALSNEIVDRTLADRPIIRRTVGDTSAKVIGGLIGSDQFARVFDNAISRAQSYLISPSQESIVIDLTSVKIIVENIISAVGNATDNPDLSSQRISQAPDQIVLLDEDKIPDLYGFSVAFSKMAPIFIILALIILFLQYFNRRNKWFYTFAVQGVAILLAGIFALLIGFVLRPSIIGLMPGANIRIILGNVFDAFIATFNSQSLCLIWGGIIMLAIGLVAANWKRIVHFSQIVRSEPRNAR